MLRWQQTPDVVFTEIVTAALEVCIDQLDDAYGETDDEGVAEFSPDAVGMFTHRELLTQLRSLLKAHQSSELWMPTDYHFLLLYRALEQQISFHNDSFSDSPCMMQFGNFVVATIDFDCLCDTYFWDTDFLIASESFDKMPSEAKAAMGFTNETFGVVHGMKPHPDELKLKLCRGEAAEPVPSESYRPGLDFPFFEDLCSTELTPGAKHLIAVVTHWESAVKEAVVSLPDSLCNQISVKDGGEEILVADVSIRLRYSVHDGQLDTGDVNWLLDDDAEECITTIRNVATELLGSKLAEHGFCFRRECWVTPDGVSFHQEDQYTSEYLRRHPDDDSDPQT